MRIFQQAGRADGNWRLYNLKERKKVLYQSVRQLCTEKSAKNGFIVCITQGQLVQIVHIHKFIENIRTQYHRFRNNYRCIFKFLEFGMTLHHIINEGKSSSFSS